jgi:hypothetical protein
VSDLISTKGHSKPSQVAFIAAVALVALAMLASVLVSRDDPARQNASGNVAAEGSPSLLFFDPGELAKDIRHVVKQAQRRTCSPQYDYPGCTKAQVRAIARADLDGWLKRTWLGSVDNVLNATDLTAAQQDRVWTDTRDNLKKILQHDAAKAVATGKVASMKAWTTDWRGNTYTLDSFPYKIWTDQFFSGCDGQYAMGTCFGSQSFQTCFDDVPNTTNGWAYLECGRTSLPDGWDGYWKGYAQWLEQGGPQGDTVCQREIFEGFVAGALGLFAGPLAAGLAFVGAGPVQCAVKILEDKWDMPVTGGKHWRAFAAKHPATAGSLLRHHAVPAARLGVR